MSFGLLGPPLSYKSRRGWLITFGVAEILIACLCLLLLLGFILLPRLESNASSPAAGSSLTQPAQMLFAAVLYGCLAAVFLVVGVGSIRCRNWARVAMLVISGFWLGSGVLSTVFILVLVPSIVRRRTSPESAHAVSIVIVAVLGFFMVVMPAVFLIFYTRKSVKATCLSSAAGQVAGISTPGSATSKVPAPIVILAVWQGLGVFVLGGFLWFRATVVFGVVLHGLPHSLCCSQRSFLASFRDYYPRCGAWSSFSPRRSWLSFCIRNGSFDKQGRERPQTFLRADAFVNPQSRW